MSNIKKIVKKNGEAPEFEIVELRDAFDPDGNIIKIRDNVKVVTIVEIEERIGRLTVRLNKLKDILTELKSIE